MEPEVFTKTENSSTPGHIAYEAAGLTWLTAAHACRIVRVLDATPTSLTEERLYEVRPTIVAAREFGASLARLHAAGADGWGCPPEGYRGLGWIGRAPLSLPDEVGPWGRFYAANRIEPYVDWHWPEAHVLRDLCEALRSGALDHPQPTLVREYARIHGDLWAGNLMWTSVGAVLIDPAAQGGHAEDDIAALALFGAPHLDQIIAGYQEVSSFAPGWQDRIGLHQMHLLVVHAHLFGGGYIGQSVEVAAQILRRIR